MSVIVWELAIIISHFKRTNDFPFQRTSVIHMFPPQHTYIQVLTDICITLKSF